MSGTGSGGGGGVGGFIGPAGIWITHKGLETWARMAREKTTTKTQVLHMGKWSRGEIVIVQNYQLFEKAYY